MKAAVVDRFWSKVRVAADDECWFWMASRTDGYGQFFVNGVRYRAHRFAYELANGPIPDGGVLDHTCHDPSFCDGGVNCPHRGCVNPAHMVVTTRTANRSSGRTSSPERRRTHCRNGHEFNEENTYLYANHRQCRVCNRDRYRARLHRKGARHD